MSSCLVFLINSPAFTIESHENGTFHSTGILNSSLHKQMDYIGLNLVSEQCVDPPKYIESEAERALFINIKQSL